MNIGIAEPRAGKLQASTMLARLPREWQQVISPPEPVARAVHALVAQHGSGVLDLDALAQLVADIAACPTLWIPLVTSDSARRRYRLAYEDERLDVWVLSWMPGQTTGFHDHGHSGVALTAVQGSVLERRLRLPVGISTRILAPSRIQTGAAGYIHSVGHHQGEPAVTLHAYSPPLGEVGQYTAEPDGTLARNPQHGRQELLDNTIP